MNAPPVLTSPLLAGLQSVRHAFFTRHGGVSGGLHASLNVGFGSDDAPADIAENRRRAAGVFGRPAEALNTCHQIHSALAVVARGAWGGERPQGDAVVTQVPGVVCSVLTADCAPILLADAHAGIVGAAHAGWKGALSGIVASTVEAMIALGADPARMVAAIGPCIGQASYEVGLEFLHRFETHAPGSGRFFAAGATPEKRQFDLPGFVISRLESVGVTRCEWLARDTCAEDTEFFSNRAAARRGQSDYGRLLSAIMLAP